MGRLTDFLNKQNGDTTRTGGLASFLRGREQDQGQDLANRISNAQTRLIQTGIEPPQPEDHSTVLEKVFGALNWLNDKKNRAIMNLSGGDTEGMDTVSGTDVLKQLGWVDPEQSNAPVAGFLFDLVTDPLNFLTFGTGGAAAGAAKAGVKAGSKLLPGAVDAAGAVARPAARLGAHIPFTKIGASVEIPGSAQVIESAGNVIGKQRQKLSDWISSRPNLSKITEGVTNIVGKTFDRNYGLPEGVGEITQRTQDLTRVHSQDVVNQVVNMRKNWESLGHTFDDDIEIIKAVEDARHYYKLNPAQIKVFNDVKDFFDMNFVKAQEAGVLGDFMQNYIPHVFKGKREEVKEAIEQLRRRGPKIRTNTPFGTERTLMVELAEVLADPDLAKRLKPETNLSKLMGIYKMSLEKAIANRDMLDELTALDGVMVKATSEFIDPKTGQMTKVNVPAPEPGWVKSTIPQIKNMWVHPEVEGHLKDIFEPFNNNVQFEKMMKFYDDVLGWWKFMATVPNVGFHVRNAIGNLWNNYLGGIKDISAYKIGHDVYTADDFPIDGFYNLIRSINPVDSVRLTAPGMGGAIPGTGIDPRDVFMQRVFDDERFRLVMTAGKNTKVSVPITRNGKTINLNAIGVKFFAKMMGVTGKGVFGGDIGEDIMKQLSNSQKGRFNPASRNFIPNKLGEKAGGYVDDVARIAHFVTKLKEGHSLEDAARSVKKYLFDYSELSAIEKNVLKRLMPFYSFTRFNLPLQLKELVKQPKYAAVMGKFQNMMAELAVEKTDDVEADPRSLPKYLRDLYSIRLPFQVGDDDRDFFVGVDVPLRDVNNLHWKEWLTMITPVIMAPAEQIFNDNLYFNRHIENFEGETVRAPGYLQGLFRLAQAGNEDLAFNDTFRGLIEKFGLAVALDEDGLPELRVPARAAHALNQLVALKNVGKGIDALTGDAADPFASASFLTGLTMVTNTEADRNTNLQYQQLTVLEDLLRKLRDEGHTVPTLRELDRREDNGLAGLFGGR